MIHYINKDKKCLTGRNNQTITNSFIIDFDVIQNVQFQFINSNNQILTIETPQYGLYIAGSINYGNDSKDLLFLSQNFEIIDNNILQFAVNTNTIPYHNKIKKPTNIKIEIGKVENNVKQVWLRSPAIAYPRVYNQGNPPEEVKTDYYTKQEINSILYNNYWTKQETAEQIANIEKLGIEVVQELPSASEGKDFTVYLVPVEGSTNNVYQEYLRINGAWELIGTTAVDLTNYAVLNGENVFVGNQTISGNLSALSATLGESTFTTNASGYKNFTLKASSPSSDQYGAFDNTIKMVLAGNRYNIIIGKEGSGNGPGSVTVYGIGINLNSLNGLKYNGKNLNTAGGIVIQDENGIIKGQKTSQNSITTISADTSAYTLSIGEFNHTPDNAVTYTLPTATAGYSNDIILQVSFANTTSITFSGTYEFDSTVTPAINDVIIYLIRYSAIKQKWIIYPLI